MILTKSSEKIIEELEFANNLMKRKFLKICNKYVSIDSKDKGFQSITDEDNQLLNVLNERICNFMNEIDSFNKSKTKEILYH